MYHWFLLLSSPCDVTSKNTPDTRLGFVAHDDPFTASLDVSERGRLFWLGLIEFIQRCLEVSGQHTWSPALPERAFSLPASFFARSFVGFCVTEPP